MCSAPVLRGVVMLAVVAQLSWAQSVEANTNASLAVEIAYELEPSLDAQLVRRLIAIEIGDVELPPKPVEELAPGEQPLRTALFFRIEQGGGAGGSGVSARILVELWERGVLYGTRRVSVEENKRLSARRIAQAAAQLVLGLRKQRIAEKKRLEKEARLRREQELEPAPWSIPARFGLEAPLRGVLLERSGWLVGASLEPNLYLENGARLGLGVGLLAGRTEQVERLRFFEVTLNPGYDLRLSQGLELGLGLTFGAAMLQVGGDSAAPEAIAGHSTWSARVSFDPKLSFAVAKGVRIGVGPELGALLRPIQLRNSRVESAEAAELGGYWLGLRVALAVDTGAPR